MPGFGDPEAWLLIFGLAPSAQGGNRTGRCFTGDISGKFLFKQLYLTNFANQPDSLYFGDNLHLNGCYITAAVKCAPPQNKPLPEEFYNCSFYFENEFFLLKNLKAVLVLGKFAFDAYLRFLKKHKATDRSFSFEHGIKITFPHWPTLYASYHPSPQNTFTKRLTEKMFLELLRSIKEESIYP